MLESVQSPISRSSERLLAYLFCLIGLLLFLPFLSINYDLNSVREAVGVERGGQDLFSPNHLLYRPMGYPVHRILEAILNYRGSVLLVLQVITALFAALGLALSLLVFARISQSVLSAALATLGMAVSWSYWRFSTDAYYITVSLPFVAAAVLPLLWIQADSHRSNLYGILSGVACAVAILLWQANVFLVPVLVLALLLFNRQSISVPPNQLIRVLALMLITLGLVVGLAYVGVGIFAFNVKTPSDFLTWLLHHPGSGSALWGHWSMDRIPHLLQSSVSSIIPLWAGLGLRDLMHGVVRPDKILGQISLLSYLFLLLGSVILAVRSIRRRHINLRLLLWLIFAYSVYLPFMLWWDPFEPKWFVIPNFFLWGMVAVIWRPSQRNSRFNRLLPLALSVSIIGLANFTYTIWPNHAYPGEMLQLAECVDGHMAPNDHLLAYDWVWSGYISYLHRRPVHSLIGQASDPEGGVNFVQEVLAATNGRVIMMKATPDYLARLEAMTGIEAELFSRLQVTPQFICNDIQFVRVVAAV
jgi:hypothetical protein